MTGQDSGLASACLAALQLRASAPVELSLLDLPQHMSITECFSALRSGQAATFGLLKAPVPVLACRFL